MPGRKREIRWPRDQKLYSGIHITGTNTPYQRFQNHIAVQGLPPSLFQLYGFSESVTTQQSKCRKQQALQNKREFDERAKDNDYDHQYKNECQGWRNVLNKAKKTPGFPSERLAAMQAAFETFKKEALRRKSLVKNGQSSLKEFKDWLVRQKSIILDLMEGN